MHELRYAEKTYRRALHTYALPIIKGTLGDSQKPDRETVAK